VFERLLSYLKGEAPADRGRDDVAFAAAVLLLETASMDDRIDQAERAVIEGILSRHFTLTPWELAALMEEAGQRQAESAQLLRFTRTVKDAMAPAERERLMEWLWEVVYADGREHAMEANLMRRIAGLIYVDDGASGAARKRVRSRLGLE